MTCERLEEHRRLWDAKPALQAVYAAWFDRLLAEAGPGQRVLEVGAGPGLFSRYARARRPDLHWVATDLLPARWNDLAADATRLPVRDAAVHRVLAVDVVHHLEDPAAFFAEVGRVLRPGGLLAAVEPWVTPLSYPVYRWLHQEGCTPGLDPLRPFPPRPGGKAAFDGDAALVPALVRALDADAWSRWGLAPPTVELINGFAYLLTLGFRPSSLLPRPLAAPMMAVDRLARGLARWTALRACLVWRRGGEKLV